MIPMRWPTPTVLPTERRLLDPLPRHGDAAGTNRMVVPFFVKLGQVSTDPVEYHPYPPPRAVEWEYWSTAWTREVVVHDRPRWVQ